MNLGDFTYWKISVNPRQTDIVESKEVLLPMELTKGHFSCVGTGESGATISTHCDWTHSVVVQRISNQASRGIELRLQLQRLSTLVLWQRRMGC